MKISIKKPAEIEKMKRSGRILGIVLAELEKMTVPGISPFELDAYAEKRIIEMGGLPAFKGYSGFPNTLCTNVNEQVVHTIPNKIPLKDGDLISIDCGVILDGYYSDSAITVAVGKCSPKVINFIETAYQALENAINLAKAGITTYQLGEIIAKTVTSQGFSIVKEMSGHGIGKELHEDPYVLNYPDHQHSTLLKKGMTIAIEPIINMGKGKIRTLDDGWTTETCDGSFSAQVEHTIAITEKGSEILTNRPK